MTDALHSRQTSVHRIESWVYANESAREGASGFTSYDVGKIAYQSDDGTYWRLIDDSPVTWQQIGGPPGAIDVFNDGEGDPADVAGSAADGTSTYAARRDHIHTIGSGIVTSGMLQDGAALAEILDDDGSGSGLDADLVDGSHASAFAASGHTHEVDERADMFNDAEGDPANVAGTATDGTSTYAARRDHVHTIGAGIVTSAMLEDGAALAEILDDDGAGSGLDADLLDGSHGSAFAASGHTHAFLGLTDTPSSYSGQAGKITRVTSGETALEFVALEATSAEYQQSSYTGSDISMGTSTDADFVDASASLQIQITPSAPGKYRAQFTFGHQKSATEVATQFRLTDGTTNSGVIESYTNSANVEEEVSLSYIFNWTDTSQKTVKLQKKVRVASSVSVNHVMGAVGRCTIMEVVRLGGTGVSYNDAEGDPAAIAASASDGTSAYAARRDHVHSDAGVIAHKNASANVHGLGASVNVLGNRNAAGEFVQRGTSSISAALGSAISISAANAAAVTFPVAFSANPIVLLTLYNTAQGLGACISAGTLSTTGFTPAVYGTASATATGTLHWIALGS